MFSKQENQGLVCWPHSLTRLVTVDLSKQEAEEEIKDPTKRMLSAKKCATVYHTTPMETLDQTNQNTLTNTLRFFLQPLCRCSVSGSVCVG